MKKSTQTALCRGAKLDQGFALLLVLVAVTLASLLALGMLAMSRLDRSSSRGIHNSDKTELLTQAALEHAVSILDHNIPQPLPPGVDPIAQLPATSPGSITNPDHAGTVPPTNWVVNPGLLTLIGPGNTSASVKYVPLSSNPTDPYTPVTTGANQDPNLNAQLVTSAGGTATYPIRNDGTPLNVGWVNVLKDPTQPASQTNPIVGRYAFWIDDESAKVNINMAYGKNATINLNNNNPLYTPVAVKDESDTFNIYSGTNPSGDNNIFHTQIGTGAFSIKLSTTDSSGNPVPTYYPLWHPAAIDLDTPFTAIDRTALANWVHNISGTDVNGNPVFNWRPLQNTEQIKRFLTATPDATYEDLKFDITTKARSPEFNVFGKSRLYLESRAPLWDSDTFFQLNYDADGPEYFQSTETAADYWTPNQTGIYSVVNSIEDKLTRTDWPGMPAASFFDKWKAEPNLNTAVNGGNGQSGGNTADTVQDALREIDQIAWNIAAWGTYAAGKEPARNVGYTVAYNGTTSNQAIVGGTLWPENNSLIPFLNNHSPPGTPIDTTTVTGLSTHAGINTISQKAFNMWCQKGLLSGKPILPYFPRPLINEIGLMVQIRDVNGLNITALNGTYSYPQAMSLNQAIAAGGYFVALQLQCEMYAPPFTAPFQTPLDSLAVMPTHFEYQIVDNLFPSGGTGNNLGRQAFDLYSLTPPAVTPQLPASGSSPNSLNNAFSSTNAGYNLGYFVAFPDNSANPLTTFSPGNYYVLTTARERVQDRTTGNYFHPPVFVASYIYASLQTSLRPDTNGLTFQDPWAPGAPPTQPYITGSYFYRNNVPPYPAGTPANNGAQGDNIAFYTGHQLIISKLRFKLALVGHAGNAGYAATYLAELAPIWDKNDASLNSLNSSATALNSPFYPPKGQTDLIDFITINHGNITIDVDSICSSSHGQAIVSVEANDARNGGNSNAWFASPGLGSTISSSASGNGNSMYGVNTATLNAKATDDGLTGSDSKYRFFDYGTPYYNSVDSRPSIGMLSIVPLGMQRNIPYDTLKFQPNSNTGQLPDWLLLDLLAPTIRPYSYMNSAMGKVNLNASIYGGGANWQNDLRWRPLQAVFQNMQATSTVTTGATTPSTVVGNIINHTSTASGLSPAEQGDGTHPGVYDYAGELCDITGVVGSASQAATLPTDAGGEWGAEGLIRNVTNLVTTKSNTFTVWGIAQSIQKSPLNNNPANQGIFEVGDQIQSTKRFTSTIERYVWPGKDGVPGNGAVNSSGNYANVATASNVSSISGTSANYYPHPSAYGASSSYASSNPSLPTLNPAALLPWLPLPVPIGIGNLEGGDDGGSAEGGPLALGATWALLDGPDVPTFPNVPSPAHASLLTNPSSRYDFGYRSFNQNAETFNGNGSGNIGNGFMAIGTHNVWGPDDPTSFWTHTALENSNNPVRAWMKYRTVDFRYLDQ